MHVVFEERDLGIALSDRRSVKVMKLMAASALLCGRNTVQPSDLWVLRYVWDREEQIEPLASLIQGVLKQQQDGTDSHPLSAVGATADAEELARKLESVEQEVAAGNLKLGAIARVKEQLAVLADQAAWIADADRKSYLRER